MKVRKSSGRLPPKKLVKEGEQEFKGWSAVVVTANFWNPCDVCHDKPLELFYRKTEGQKFSHDYRCRSCVQKEGPAAGKGV